jgi:transposase InsO family protein
MCRLFSVTPQGYRKWRKNQDKPYKHALLLAQMYEILDEDPENENYGVERMFSALQIKFNYTGSISTVARVMRQNGLTHEPKRKPKGLTKADKAAQASDNLLKGDFKADAPNLKWVTDITQLPTADGPLYISGIFDCYDNHAVGLTMADHMRKELVIDTAKQAMMRYGVKGVILHSDRGSQYTSYDFKACCKELGIIQSMNSAGGRCHDNAKCESMWGRAKVEKFHKIDTSKMRMEMVKMLVFKYFMGYWNNRRICTANGGFPPAMKRSLYFTAMQEQAA